MKLGWLRDLFKGETPLTREAIDTLPPRKLFFKVLYGLPDAAQASEVQHDLVRMYLLDGEVRNGGFNQYYYNTDEQRHEAERAFARAGAQEVAALVRRANDRFESEEERLRACWDGTRKGFAKSYSLKLFDEFDRAYYALVSGDRFFALAAQFIRRHADAFLPAADNGPQADISD